MNLIKNSTLILITFLVLISCSNRQENYQQSEFSTYNLDSIISIAQKNPDSTIAVFKSKFEKALDKKQNRKAIKLLFAIGSIYDHKQEYGFASDYIGEALFLAEESKDTFAIAATSKRLGEVYYALGQREKSSKFLNKSLNLYKLNKGKYDKIENKILGVYHELSLSNSFFKEYKLSQQYLDSCFYVINNTPEIKLSPIDIGFLETQRGKNFIKQHQYYKGIKTLKKVEKTFEEIAPNSEFSTQREYLIIIYTNLAKAYNAIDNNEKALEYFEKAYNTKTTRYTGHRINALSNYSKFAKKTKDFEKAYYLLEEFHKTIDVKINFKSKKNKGYLIIKDKYKENIKNKNYEIKENKKKLLHLQIVLFSISLVFLITFLIIRNRYLKQTHKSERKRTKMDQERIEKNLTQKNKELTASTLKLVEYEKTVNSLIEYIELISKDKRPDILKSIKNRNTNLWDEFNSRFIEVNKDFYAKLNAINPKLSASELKLCALIKLNFSSKEIAHLIGISDSSVNTARYRLRKKLNLGKDDNLTSFINTI